jgi:hypothetical protein
MSCVVALLAARPGMGLMVTEVMYHPLEEGGTPLGDETLEFIELYNNRAVFEDLSGYAFTNGITYEFEPGTILGPKQYLVVAREPAMVEAAYDVNGVYGPWSGRLNNDGERIELSNANGEIIISFRYGDGRPWPASPDGTGHSLILAKFGGDPEEASTWAPSTFIGGTPGGPDEAQLPSEEPILVNLVNVGNPGRYFKGIEEPSPGPGGEPTTAWTQIGFNDDPNTTAWLDGPTGYGYSSLPSKRQYLKTLLYDMNGNYISVYARLRFTLTAEQIASFSQLRAEVHYDDDFVLYLNGQRVAASDGISGDPPPYDAGRGTGWDPPAANIELTSRMNLLVVGTNVLAIQVHNSQISGSSDCIASPILRALETGGAADPRVRVVINELLANSDAPPGTDWLELYNPGSIPVSLDNVYLSDDRFNLLQYEIPNGVVLEPGQFWAVTEGMPPEGFGFGLSFTGETIYVTAAANDLTPQPIRVLDAVRYGPVEPDVTLGRFPDGSEYFGPLTCATYGGPNARPLVHDIVINEIMYNHSTHDDRYEYIELYNQGPNTVEMNGWAITDGVTYEFNEPMEMLPGSYLVVAKDPNFLAGVYDNLVVGTNLIGPYSGTLSNQSERIRLSYPFEDVNMVTGQPELYLATADEVTYYEGGRWPTWADGQGASLELRDPRSDNDTPDAWAASDESGKTAWGQFSYTINSTDARYTHDYVTIFDVILLNRGEVLLDDLEMIIGSNCLTNNGFESGESGWRILGNHVRSFVTTEDRHSGSNSLHLIATGHGDPGANRINRSVTGVTASTVTFRGWARWLRGCPFLLLRASREQACVQPPRPSYAFKLNMPLDLGTPGAQNTAFVANRGPDILEIRHAPVSPADGQPIVVTARVIDNDGVDSVTLHHRVEGGAGFVGVPMVDDGSGDDVIAGDGIFTATMAGVPANTMLAFYIEASDGSASTRFPTPLEPSAEVPNRTCLVRVGDALLDTQFATYRVWLSNDVISTFTSRPNLSNELLDCTFVYNDRDVFYNTRLRYRGSPFIRSGCCRDPRDRYAYRIDFNPDQTFRGREEINLDSTEDGNRGPLQERASYWFYAQMGLQFSMQEFVHPIINGNSNFVYEDVQKIDGHYVDMWFPDDTEGYIHKIDDYFEYSADGTGFSNLDEGLKLDSSHPLLKETYRWGFEKRSHGENDTWDHLFELAVALNTPSSSSTYEQKIESVLHPAHFARVLAVRHAVGDWDSYGYNRGKNNCFYYALPEGKWYLVPWDIDFTLGSGDGPSTDLFAMETGEVPEVYQFLNYQRYRWMYLQAFSDLVHGPWKTSYLTADPPTAFDRFLDDAANALIADGLGSDRRDGIKAFVRDRRAYILTQVPSFVFEITTNSGRDFCTSDSIVTIKGAASPHVAGIAVNGEPVPAQFSANNAFAVDIPLAVGENPLTLEGLDGLGNPLGLTDSITVTRVLPCAVTSVTPSIVRSNRTAHLTISGSNFEPESATSPALARPSDELGFDALYVQSNEAFDRIDAATLLLDDPERGLGDPVRGVHPWINLYSSGTRHGEFPDNELSFAPPFDVDSTNFAVRFTGYIYAPSPGVRYFGVNSDEGFTLSIDGQLVGEYATVRPPRGSTTTDVIKNRTSGTMTFDFPAAGRYYLVLDFFENSGGEEIELFQTDASAGDLRLINFDAELIVFRDNDEVIDGTGAVVADTNTITCDVDLDGAQIGTWNVVVTPPCGEAAECRLDNALQIVACSDLNADSLVNFEDWAELAGHWDEMCSEPDFCAGADLDSSGSVGPGDLKIFAQEWLLDAGLPAEGLAGSSAYGVPRSLNLAEFAGQWLVGTAP